MTTLNPVYRLGALNLTEYPYAIEFGGDHGAPETVADIVQSLLADGDLVSKSRDGNRELTLVVIVEGADLAAIAANEAALRLECSKALNELWFSAGDGYAPTSVFEVFPISMRFVKDDVQEMSNLRRWELTIPAAPYARSAALTVVEPLSNGGTPSTITIDSCDSLTGWAPEGGDSLVLDTTFSAVRTLDTNVTRSVALTRTGAINTTSNQYLKVYWQVKNVSPVATAQLRVSPGVGADFVEVWRTYLPTADSTPWFVSYYAVDPGRITSGGFYMQYVYTPQTERAPSSPLSLAIAGVETTNVAPSVTPKQTSKTIAVGGTERTPGSIHIAAPNGSTNLGSTIVHTSPNDGSGYAPPLRPWRTTGNALTADTTAMSGTREPVNGTTVASSVPVSAVPAGGYSLMARMKSSVVGSFQLTVQVRSYYNGAYLEPAMTIFPVATFGATNTWTMIPLALLSLPIVRGEGQSYLRFDLARSPVASEIIEYDDWYIFRADDDCGLTLAEVAQPNMWLDSPSLTSLVPTAWVGPNADRTNQRSPSLALQAMGSHIFHPSQPNGMGGVSVFTATSGVEYPDVTLSHYKRWHSNAAE